MGYRKFKEPFPVDILIEYLALIDGQLFWRKRPGKAKSVKPGMPAGPGKHHRYCNFRLFGKTVYTHRAVYAIVNGRWPEGEIDHIDGDTRNNFPSNLRIATRAQNLSNRKTGGRNTSGRTGVRRATNRWSAYIMVNGKHINLGSHEDFDFACFVREIAEDKYHGQFKRDAHVY